MFEEERGIAYSINNESLPTVLYLTDVELLSENNWFYYEADYNEWRIDN